LLMPFLLLLLIPPDEERGISSEGPRVS
jgi:hypothetical protein